MRSGFDSRGENALTAKVEAVTMFASECGLTMPVHGRLGSLACPFDNSDLGVKIGSTIGQTKTYAHFAFGTSSPWTPQRQLATHRPGMLERNAAMLVGVSQGLLGDRLRLTTELAWTETRETALFNSPLQGRTGRSLHGTAKMVRAEARLLDLPSVQWTLKGEYSAVSNGFATRQAVVLDKPIALPGRRVALSSALKFGGSRVTAAFDDYRSFLGTGTTRRLGVSSNGISLTLGSKSFAFQPSPGQAPMPASRSAQTSLTLDFDVASLPSSIAAPLKVLGPLAPQSVMLHWRSGWSESGYAGAVDRYRRKGWDLSTSWETPIGETTFDYSLDRRLGVAPLAVTKTNKTFQISHTVRWGDWRLGGDVMLSQYTATGARSFREKSWSAGQTLAYSRPDGPEFRLRIGQDSDRMRYNDNSYASQSTGLNVTATLDLTRFLRKRFERNDLLFKLEYRKRMDSNDETYALLEDLFERSYERTDRSVFLLSAGMKF